MNITQTISDDRQLVKEISRIECAIVEAICEDPKWLTRSQEASLRWALSLARVSAVMPSSTPLAKDIVIGHATDRYRESLYSTLRPFVGEKSINKKSVLKFIDPIANLCADERNDLLQLYGAGLSPDDLDRATRTRPLALSLGGGGGTAFIYLGAFEAFERESIYPDAIAGTSMGAMLGAYRARYKKFTLDHVKEVMDRVSFDRIARPFKASGQFSLPATFRLHLRDLFGNQFEENGVPLRLRELEIPLRIAVAGLAHIEGQQDVNLDEFAHLLDDTKSIIDLRRQEKSITAKLLGLSRQPLKAIYLGDDEPSREFDVIDAIGFSSAVPGIFHYDVMPGDNRMRELVESTLRRHGVYRLLDGGWVDNLPSQSALSAVQEQVTTGRDPFVLGLDSFAPNYHRHWLFLPLMQMAAQNTRVGREVAHRTITYKHVLSPVNVVPSKEELLFALHNGIEETKPHLAFIRKMIEPIDDPMFLRNSK